MTFKSAVLFVAVAFIISPAIAETFSTVATPNAAGTVIKKVIKLSSVYKCPDETVAALSTLGKDRSNHPRWTNADSYDWASTYTGDMSHWRFWFSSSQTGDLQYYAMENGACVLKSVPQSKMQEHKLYKYDIVFPAHLIDLTQKLSVTKQGGKVIERKASNADARLVVTYENMLPNDDTIRVNGNTVNFTFPIKPAQ